MIRQAPAGFNQLFLKNEKAEKKWRKRAGVRDEVQKGQTR